MKPTTIGKAINMQIAHYQVHIDYLKQLRAKRTDLDEPALKLCPNCGTKNYHYNPINDTWVCASC